MENWLSAVGSTASIAGAVWAFIEARKSREYAGQSLAYRDELIERRQVIELSKIHSETTRILREVSKVGPTCTQLTVKTVNCAEVAKAVEEYVRMLNEQRSHFSDMFDNEAKVLCDELKLDIETLSEAENFEGTKAVGKNIYYKIEEFLPRVKNLTDEKKER
jgi:aspartate-semialdehyde dehydrogenase